MPSPIEAATSRIRFILMGEIVASVFLVLCYFLDKKLKHVGDNDLNIETGKELGVGLYSTCEQSEDLKQISPDELAGKLLDYDHILPY